MPKVVEGKVTEDDKNHPLYFLTEKDSYLFTLGKEKGLTDDRMAAMSVVAIADIPVQNGETMNISPAEELEEAAGMAEPLVYDKEKKRLVAFYPSAEYIKKNMGTLKSGSQVIDITQEPIED